MANMLLSLMLFAWASQGAYIAPRTVTAPTKPTPTPESHDRLLKARGGLPSGVVEVGGIPAPLCVSKNMTDYRTLTREEPVGVMWVPGIPWDEPGQTIYFDTDTNGIKFQNVFFSDPASNLQPYTSLLQAYANSSGWSMVMPTSVPPPSVSAPTITFTASTAGITSWNLKMANSANCNQDKYAPISSMPLPSELPFVNSLLQLPAVTTCSHYATSTATYSTEIVMRVDEFQVPAYQGVNQSDYWNQTGAVWSISTGNDSGVRLEMPKYAQGGDNPSLLFTLAPTPTAVSWTIPYYWGTPTGWGIIFSPTATADTITAVTVTASAKFACTSDVYANPIYQGAIPCTKGDPLYVTDTENWIFRNVDYSLSNYWHNYPTRTTPGQPNVPAPTGTINVQALPAQLAFGALNVHIDCSPGAGCLADSAIDWCQADQTPYLPIWTYLSLIAISNLHNQLDTLYNLMAFAEITVGDWGLSFVSEFTDDVGKAAQLQAEQVALAVTGTVVSVLAAFFPMINFEKVGANVAVAEAKVGSVVGPKGEGLIPAIGHTPKENGDPESDPAMPADSDVNDWWKNARNAEEGQAPPPGGPGLLDPGDDWAGDFSFVNTRPVRNPILTPPASEVDEEEEEGVALTPDIGRREAQVLLGTIPGSVLTGSQTIWAKYDPDSVDVAQQGGTWQAFIANITTHMQTQLDLFHKGILTDPTMTDVLLTYLYGGTYVSGSLDETLVQYFLRTDLTARAINNVWNSYLAYVSFTDLGDPKYGNSTPACNSNTAGPQSTKFCGVGGVFYLYMLSQGDQNQGEWAPPGEQGGLTDVSLASYPGQIMPYGLDKFSTDENLNLSASGPTEGSARAWNATQSVDVTNDQSLELMNNIGDIINGANQNDLYNIIGRLPGEWAIPVCNQGKNQWGADYTKTNGVNLGYLPCACGYQGNETANFFKAIGIKDNDLYNLAFYCCEGSLLFPTIKNSKVTVNANTGPGASGLEGGVWPDNAPLYYGTITAEDIHNKPLHCSNKGVLTPAPNTD